MVNRHAFNILDHPEGGYVVMDSLTSTISDETAFYVVCPDIDTLELALLMHVTSRFDSNNIKGPWDDSLIDSLHDERSFSAVIFSRSLDEGEPC